MKIPPELDGLSKRDLIRIILAERGAREILEKRVVELEKKLFLYENPHTPSSKQRFPPKKERKEGGKVGAPEGHTGVTREKPEPDEVVEHVAKCCPFCGSSNLKKKREKRRVVEEIPEPQPVKVTEHVVRVCVCENCGKTVVPFTDLPGKGFFGKNLLSHVTLLKFEDRLPLRKVVQSLKRQHNIILTHGTVLGITNYVSEKLRTAYNQIVLQTRTSPYVYTDQTEIKIDSIAYDLWVFVTAKATLFIIRKGKRKQVMEEILGKKYEGIIIGDGLETYRQYTDQIQRCWAHLLREAKSLAEKHEGQARLTYEELKQMYEKIKNVTLEHPPPERQELYDKLVQQMQRLINRINVYQEMKGLATKISNGLKHWFTKILHPYIEATSNTAERALRELVVIRKIIGGLRKEKGAKILETIMTMITTWQQNKLDTFTQLRNHI